MFDYWRGPIIFRFKIVATPYHQGRIRLTYEPVGDISVNTPDYASVFNEVVDLAHTSDFEVVVPYMQSVGWVRCFQDTSPAYKSNALLGQAHSDGNDNGMIAVRAVTKLTAPVSSSTINIQVFVRAGEEFEVANPTAIQNGRTHLTVQSGTRAEGALAYGDVHQIVISDQRPENHDDTFLVYMGEKVSSMRQVLNRTNQAYSTQYVGIDGGQQYVNLTLYQTLYPAWFGYTTTGHHSAKNQAGTADVRFNFTPPTHFHDVVACFAGMRGSMQWHYNLDTTASAVVPSHMAVTRHNLVINTGNYAETNYLATVTTNNVPQQVADTDYSAGAALTNTRTNTGLSVLAPFYNQNRFVSTSYWTGDTGSNLDLSDRMNLRLRMTYYPNTGNPNALRVDRYFSVGPDFQVFFFLAAAPYALITNVTPS